MINTKTEINIINTIITKNKGNIILENKIIENIISIQEAKEKEHIENIQKWLSELSIHEQAIINTTYDDIENVNYYLYHMKKDIEKELIFQIIKNNTNMAIDIIKIITDMFDYQIIHKTEIHNSDIVGENYYCTRGDLKIVISLVISYPNSYVKLMIINKPHVLHKIMNFRIYRDRYNINITIDNNKDLFANNIVCGINKIMNKYEMYHGRLYTYLNIKYI